MSNIEPIKTSGASEAPELIISTTGLHKTYDTGEVMIRGQALYRMRDNARTDFRAQNMGFIFQTFNLLPVLTVVENVERPHC